MSTNKPRALAGSRIGWAAIFAAIWIVGCNISPSGPDLPESYTTAEAFIEEAGFQGSVSVLRGSQVVARRGFGLAEAARQVPNGIDTKFRLASVTKGFTAMAVVQLLREGLIAGFDEPLATYLPEHPRAEDITIRHLLTHRSGLPEYVTLVDGTADLARVWEPGEIFDLVRSKPLEFEPGGPWQYSNTNYLVLGMLIERVSGRDYFDIVADRLLAPLGMTNTEYATTLIEGSGYARGYMGSELASSYNMSVAYAAGALVSNVTDLELWLQGVRGDLLLDEATRSEVFPPAPVADGGEDVGMGWGVVNNGGQTVYMHTGGVDGFSTLVALFPDVDGSVVLLSNQEDQGALLLGILQRLAEEEFR